MLEGNAAGESWVAEDIGFRSHRLDLCTLSWIQVLALPDTTAATFSKLYNEKERTGSSLHGTGLVLRLGASWSRLLERSFKH